MKLKNKVIIISLLLIIVAISFTLFKTSKIIEYIEINNRDLVLVSNEVEVYSKVNIKDILYIDNGEFEDQKIDTTSLGLKKIEIKYKKEDKYYKTYISINIYDRIAPYVGLYGSYIHTIGKKFNIDLNVLAGDNYSRELKKEVIGNYDLNKVGSYSLKYKVSDESGNSTVRNFTLKVVKPKANSPSSPSSSSSPVKLIPLSDMIANKPENAVLMIDVSKWQKEINWKKVKEAGIEYAMIRIGTQKDIDKDSRMDVYFTRNYEEATKNGIKVGVYYFSYARSIKDAKKQAEWVLKTLDNKKLDLPVAFDWECWNLFNYFKISFYDLNQIARTFMKNIEKGGYKSINYGSKNYMQLVWNIEEYPTWLAHYTNKTNYSKPYLMWQFTSSGEIPGIKGGVDVNYYYK